jgi:hypothetical protein
VIPDENPKDRGDHILRVFTYDNDEDVVKEKDFVEEILND